MNRSHFARAALVLAAAAALSPPLPAHAKEARVAILSIVRGYDPARVTVASGESVTWVNEDADALHNAVCDASCPEPFSSGPSAPKGAVGSYRFTKVGTYRYHCELHPNMLGDVVVTEAAVVTTTTPTTGAARTTTTSSASATTSSTVSTTTSTTSTTQVAAYAPPAEDVETVLESEDDNSKTVLVVAGVLLATALISYFATRAGNRRL